jgi:hypothetical protein
VANLVKLPDAGENQTRKSSPPCPFLDVAAFFLDFLSTSKGIVSRRSRIIYFPSEVAKSC